MPIIHSEDGVPPSKERMVTMGGSFNDTVNAGTTHVKTFTPPRGKKWQLIGMKLWKMAPTGALSGTHYFQVLQAGEEMIIGKSVYSTDLNWNTSRWVLADDEQAPAGETTALLAVHGIIADTANPLIMVYRNATDANNTNSGEITAHVLETSII